MAGYVASRMVRTPWGDASQLRDRRLPTGRGTPPEEAARNQRERLFGAMVATVASKGYAATTVADLEELSGVSRSGFYKHFADKQACFQEAVEALMNTTMTAVTAAGEGEEPVRCARSAFSTFIAMIAAQPAAARMCFVEIYAAGPEAILAVDRAIELFEDYIAGLLEQISGRAGMPREIVRALIGGLRKPIHNRLYNDAAEELPRLAEDLMDWALAYEAPPAPLRRRRRRQAALSGGADLPPAERIMQALAETVAAKGYPETTVAEIVARAKTSQRTFYEHFADREEAMLAALDSGAAQMLAAVLPAFRRAPDWPHAVRAALEAMLAFGAAQPGYAQLGSVEIYAAGSRALAQRDETMHDLEKLLAPGFEIAPGLPPIAAEATGGAVYTLLYDQVRAKGPERLAEIAPLATYVTLAPFVGAERACELANGRPAR